MFFNVRRIKIGKATSYDSKECTQEWINCKQVTNTNMAVKCISLHINYKIEEGKNIDIIKVTTLALYDNEIKGLLYFINVVIILFS